VVKPIEAAILINKQYSSTYAIVFYFMIANFSQIVSSLKITIKNIIFDISNVVVRRDPHASIHDLFSQYGNPEQQILFEEILHNFTRI
jgi:hypothetical protein